MNYEEFKDDLVQAVQEALSERGTKAAVTTNMVEKMNDKYEAITITPEGSNVGMNLSIDVLAEAYENGTDFDEIVDKLVEKFEHHLPEMPIVDVQMLTDYEQMLAKDPHQQLEDMAIVYRFVMESDYATLQVEK